MKNHLPRRPSTLFAIASVAFLAAYAALLPFTSLHPLLGGFGYLIPPVAALAVAPGAIRRTTGRTRAGWQCVALMLLAWTAAEAVYSFNTLILGRETPFPSVADGLYYLGYVVLCVAVVLLANTGRAFRDYRATVDGAAVSLVLGAFTWHFLAQPAAAGAEDTASAITALGYPLLDLALVCALTLAYLGGGSHRPRWLIYLIASVATLLVTDAAYGLLREATVDEASPLDLGWLLSYALLGMALLEARPPKAAAADNDLREESRFMANILPHVTVLPLVIVGAVLEVRGTHVPDLLFAAMGAMAIRSVRQLFTVAENRRLYQASRLRAEELQRLAAELEHQRQKAIYLSEHDPLTSLLNRRAWFERARPIQPRAVIVLDIDHFKTINDRYGHPAGDEALRQVSRLLLECVGENGVVARLGGEEFGAMITAPACDARALANAAVAQAAATTLRLGPGISLTATLSAGVSVWDGDAAEGPEILDALYREADEALFDAKRQGRSRSVSRAATVAHRAA